MAAKLILDIAWTHVTARVRQTLVGMAGVAMGVGFTIMMAGLMEGSQIDFLRQLVDTMPHVTVQDERRAAPAQPADREYGAVQMSGVANVGSRPGIKYPETAMASLRSWLPGDVAPQVKTTAIVDYCGGRVGVTLVGIDPRQEVRVSKLATQMREGQINDLNRAPNAVIIGQALAEKLAVKAGNTVIDRRAGHRGLLDRGRDFPLRDEARRRRPDLCAAFDRAADDRGRAGSSTSCGCG